MARFVANLRGALRWSGPGLTLIRAAMWPLSRDSTLMLRVRVEYKGACDGIAAQGPSELAFERVAVPYSDRDRERIATLDPVHARGLGQPTGAVIATLDGKVAGHWSFRQQGDDLYDRGVFVADWARGRGVLQGLIAFAVEGRMGNVFAPITITNRPSHRGFVRMGFRARRIAISGVWPGRKPRRRWTVRFRVGSPDLIERFVTGSRR